MTGPTPGPWAISKYSGGGAHELDIEVPGKGWFLRISPGYQYQEFPDPVEVKEEFEANARLIAAAPETAAELERAQETIADLLHVLKAARAELQECSVELTGEDYNNPAMNDAISRATPGTGAQDDNLPDVHYHGTPDPFSPDYEGN